jgi:hypothetical protein
MAQLGGADVTQQSRATKPPSAELGLEKLDIAGVLTGSAWVLAEHPGRCVLSDRRPLNARQLGICSASNSTLNPAAATQTPNDPSPQTALAAAWHQQAGGIVG